MDANVRDTRKYDWNRVMHPVHTTKQDDYPMYQLAYLKVLICITMQQNMYRIQVSHSISNKFEEFFRFEHTSINHWCAHVFHKTISFQTLQ